MLRPEDTPIPHIYDVQLLEEIEELTDQQLSNATTMVVHVMAQSILITRVGFAQRVEHLDLDLLRVVSQRYLEHWVVEVQPEPHVWFRMTPKESFRQRMLAKLEPTLNVTA